MWLTAGSGSLVHSPELLLRTRRQLSLYRKAGSLKPLLALPLLGPVLPSFRAPGVRPGYAAPPAGPQPLASPPPPLRPLPHRLASVSPSQSRWGGGRVPQFRGGGKHLPSQARPCTDPRHEAMGSALGLLSQPPQLRFLQQSVREPRPSPCFVFPFRVSSHVPPSRAGQCHSALELPALLRQLLPVS